MPQVIIWLSCLLEAGIGSGYNGFILLRGAQMALLCCGRTVVGAGSLVGATAVQLIVLLRFSMAGCACRPRCVVLLTQLSIACLCSTVLDAICGFATALPSC